MLLTHISTNTQLLCSRPFVWFCATLLFLYTAFLIFVSIIPFGTYQQPTSPFPYDLLYGWLNRIYLYDILQNLFAYIPYGCLVYILLRLKVQAALTALVFSFMAGFLLSSVLEIIQSFNAVRISSLLDIVLNGTGALIGGLAGIALLATESFWIKQFNLSFKVQEGNPWLKVFSIVCVLAWVCYHLYPFIPSVHPNHLNYAIKSLMTWEPFNGFVYIQYMLNGTFLYIISTPLVKPNRRLLILFIFLICVMSIKFVIISRYLSIEALLGIATSILMLDIIFKVCAKADKRQNI